MTSFFKKNRGGRNNGWVTPVLILILIMIVFIYYFTSQKKKGQAIDISGSEYEGYLDPNVVALNTLPLLETGEITLKDGETKNFKNKNFTLNIRRGKNQTIDNNTFSCYLLETVDELDPSKIFQYVVVGIPKGGSMYKYHIVSFRQKTFKG